VTELDTCGLQVLLMLRRAAAAQGRQLRLLAPSAVVRDVLTLCGLEALWQKSA
jgi:anti-anti-sigma factor